MWCKLLIRFMKKAIQEIKFVFFFFCFACCLHFCLCPWLLFLFVVFGVIVCLIWSLAAFSLFFTVPWVFVCFCCCLWWCLDSLTSCSWNWMGRNCFQWPQTMYLCTEKEIYWCTSKLVSLFVLILFVFVGFLVIFSFFCILGFSALATLFYYKNGFDFTWFSFVFCSAQFCFLVFCPSLSLCLLFFCVSFLVTYQCISSFSSSTWFTNHCTRRQTSKAATHCLVCVWFLYINSILSPAIAQTRFVSV